VTSPGGDVGLYQLNFTDAEWAAWRDGAAVDDILAARPAPSLTDRITEWFKSEPEAGL
jgi:hypothetical protein